MFFPSVSNQALLALRCTGTYSRAVETRELAILIAVCMVYNAVFVIPSMEHRNILYIHELVFCTGLHRGRSRRRRHDTRRTDATVAIDQVTVNEALH